MVRYLTGELDGVDQPLVPLLVTLLGGQTSMTICIARGGTVRLFTHLTQRTINWIISLYSTHMGEERITIMVMEDNCEV